MTGWTNAVSPATLTPAMVKIHPFTSLIVDPALATRVSCVPYDIVSRTESRALTEGNPDSLLRVDRVDLEFPDSVSFTAPEVYRQAAKNFAWLVEQRRFLPEKKPSVYLDIS